MNIADLLPNLNNIFQNQNTFQTKGNNNNFNNTTQSKENFQTTYTDIYNCYPKYNIDDKSRNSQKVSTQFNNENIYQNSNQANNQVQNNMFQNNNSLQGIGNLLSMFMNNSSGDSNPLTSLLGNFLKSSNSNGVQNFMLKKDKNQKNDDTEGDSREKKISDYIFVENED